MIKILKNTLFNNTKFTKEISIEEGDIVHVYGDIGSGKTTFLNTLYCLLVGRYENNGYVVDNTFNESEVAFIAVNTGINDINMDSLFGKKVVVFESAVNTLPVNFLKLAKEKGITTIFSTSLIDYKFDNVKTIKLVK